MQLPVGVYSNSASLSSFAKKLSTTECLAASEYRQLLEYSLLFWPFLSTSKHLSMQICEFASRPGSPQTIT